MKGLLALALMVALLAIGNTAGAGPLGVNMGDPLNARWDAKGLGIEMREYKGDLPFDAIVVRGTRDGGACQVVAGWSVSSREAKQALDRDLFKKILPLLDDKYGEPDEKEVSEAQKRISMRWFLSGSNPNPDSIHEILLSISEPKPEKVEIVITYYFKNYDECKKAEAAEIGL